jgi:uncharacterized protein
MPVEITPLYAAPLVLLYMALSGYVILYRRGRKIPLGDAGDPELLSRVRAQGNCAEYMPFGLLLLMMAELASGPSQSLHIAGIALVAGRFVHAAHLSYYRSLYILRVIAVALTFASYLRAISLAVF